MKQTDGTRFSARLTSCGPQVRLELSGEIDVDVRDELRAALGVAVTTGADVVIDLTRVSFIDASGVGALVRAHRRLRGDHALHLCGARPGIRRVLDITGVRGLFIEDDPVAPRGGPPALE